MGLCSSVRSQAGGRDRPHWSSFAQAHRSASIRRVCRRVLWGRGTRAALGCAGCRLSAFTDDTSATAISKSIRTGLPGRHPAFPWPAWGPLPFMGSRGAFEGPRRAPRGDEMPLFAGCFGSCDVLPATTGGPCLKGSVEVEAKPAARPVPDALTAQLVGMGVHAVTRATESSPSYAKHATRRRSDSISWAVRALRSASTPTPIGSG